MGAEMRGLGGSKTHASADATTGAGIAMLAPGRAGHAAGISLSGSQWATEKRGIHLHPLGLRRPRELSRKSAQTLRPPRRTNASQKARIFHPTATYRLGPQKPPGLP